MNDLFTYAAQQKEAQSPFESIKRIDGRGKAYWSARDLMPMLGYGRWENFQESIQRAVQAALNQGQPANTLFRGVTKKGAGRPQQDYELARYACYLVAMNGDPRKPEVAAAQSYFAIQTRVAETQAPAEPDLSSLEGIAQLLKAAQNAVDMAQQAKALAAQAEERAEVSEARIELIEGGHGFSVREFHKHYFSEVPERQLTELLYSKNLLLDQRGQRINKNGKRVPGKQHRHPSYKGKPYFFLDPYIDEEGDRHYQTKVRPGAPETDLVRLLESYGLRANQNQTSQKELNR